VLRCVKVEGRDYVLLPEQAYQQLKAHYPSPEPAFDFRRIVVRGSLDEQSGAPYTLVRVWPIAALCTASHPTGGHVPYIRSCV
jgi:hypothetical protein